LDITKISYGVLPLVLSHYRLLDSGSALGTGVGPLLIAHPSKKEDSVEDSLIAIPGEHTTAHLLFSRAYPSATNKIFLRYDQIESFVQEDKGLGVIIHENRFTYEAKGLCKILDLGEHWENLTGSPIPLGGIVINRKFDYALQLKINQLIQASIEYAHLHNHELSDFIQCNAQEMSQDIMRKHIELYVNQYSLSLGKEGREAVMQLLKVSASNDIASMDPASIFL
jgi:1,4-dihydroxy-6-naphthoate synthase